MKGWLSCLPVMRMAAGPGLRAGMSTCQEPLFFAVSLSGWPSRLADSRVGACVVSSLTGLPGLPWASRLHPYMLPCLLMAVTLPPALTACTYCRLPSSARLGASPGFQAQAWPSVPVMMAWLSLPLIWLACAPSGSPTAVELVVLSARYRSCPCEPRRRNPLLRVWA